MTRSQLDALELRLLREFDLAAEEALFPEHTDGPSDRHVAAAGEANGLAKAIELLQEYRGDHDPRD